MYMGVHNGYIQWLYNLKVLPVHKNIVTLTSSLMDEVITFGKVSWQILARFVCGFDA